MKIPPFLIFFSFTLLLACTTKQKKEGPVNQEVKAPEKKEVTPDNLKLNSNDSSSYIGFIEHFYPNNDPYIELYFKKDDIAYEEYEKLSQTGDSIIYKDDENERTRIPATTAQKHFDLSGLEPLYLYDKDHKFLAKANLQRVEFLNQNISPLFIGVFDIDKAVKEKASYCIGNLQFDVKPVIYQEFKDPVLTKQIAGKFKISNIEATHYKNQDTNAIFSIINSDTNSYIIEKLNDNLKVLYTSAENESIRDVTFITRSPDKKPIVLAHCVMPEGDMEWTNLLVFDGKEYKISEKQRLK